MSLIDWLILGAMVLAAAGLACFTQRYTRSVSDFVAAGRCAGRYTLAVSEGASTMGAISVVMMFELYYRSGFSSAWWSLMQLPLGIIIALTGWLVYRFRETRALTLAQFFEMRYSRAFRIFCGALAFVSGALNYGLFPLIGAKFFLVFLGLPATVTVLGATIGMQVLLMALFLGIALTFVFVGGQIAILVTDFFQGVFCNVVFVVLIIFFLVRFDWSHLTATVAASAEGRRLFDPLRGGVDDEFGFLFWLVASAAMFFNNVAWQGRSGFNVAARSPHEARMAKVLGAWRQKVIATVMVVMPVCVWALLHDPAERALAASIQAHLAAVPASGMHDQMLVPIALLHLLPPGLIGLFAAMMFASMIATDQPYLHSWGTILVQDVILPLRRRPLSPRAHVWLIRAAIFSVALFAFIFGQLFELSTYITMYLQVTGAIFMGGAGAVIIGGLYWRRGTTAAAWSTMLFGSGFALFGVFATNYLPGFPLNGMHMFGLTMLGSGALYVIVSLLTCREPFNLERMLHRGAWRVEGAASELPARGWRALVNHEFTRADKAIYAIVLLWTLGLFGLFAVITAAGLGWDLPFTFWSRFWLGYVYATGAVGLITAVWFGIGGTADVIRMFRTLARPERDFSDDGRVAADSRPPGPA